MTLTKQTFELLADIIRQTDVDDQARRTFALAVANKLDQTNPRFDFARFLRACGVS